MPIEIDDDAPAGPDEAAYRSLCGTAVAALAAGCLAPVALLTPVAWPLALVAGALALVAIAQVRRRPESLTGAGLAAAGLALAIAVGAAVVARGMVVSRSHAAHAERVARRFLDALAEGDFVAANELTLSFGSRQPDHESAEVLYRDNAEARERLEQFRKQPPIAALSDTSEGAPRIIVRTPPSDGPHGSVRALFSVAVWPSDAERRRRVNVATRRDKVDEMGHYAWRVEDFAFEKPPE